MLFLVLIQLSAAGYFKIFDDSFDSLDNWVIDDISGEDSGYNEWGYYAPREKNVFIKETKHGRALILKQIKDGYEGYSYTGGQVHSKSTWGPYGFFQVKAIIPKGNGLWPAIYLSSPDGISTYGEFPASGEINIVETVCDSKILYFVAHYGNKNNPDKTSRKGRSDYPGKLDRNIPHNFGVEVAPSFIRYWLDANVEEGVIKGELIAEFPASSWYSLDSNDQKHPDNAPFNLPLNIFMSLGYGGSWPCFIKDCCEREQLVAEMEIFYFQVWEYRE